MIRAAFVDRDHDRAPAGARRRDTAHRLKGSRLLEFFGYGPQKIRQQGPYGQATD
jgi:hypothetical protein